MIPIRQKTVPHVLRYSVILSAAKDLKDLPVVGCKAVTPSLVLRSFIPHGSIQDDKKGAVVADVSTREY